MSSFFKIALLSLICLLAADTFSQQKVRKAYQYYEEAESYYRDGLNEQAKRILDECLKIYPGFMEAYKLRGAAKEQLNDLQGAISDYSSFLEKYPDNPEALMASGLIRFRLGFYDQARADLLKVLQLNSSETNVLLFRQNMSLNDKSPILTTTNDRHKATVFNYLGLIEMKDQRPKQGLAYFDSAIRRDSREPDFYVNRGLVKETLGDSTAIVDYQLALSINPDHALAKHNLTALAAKQGRKISLEDRLTTTIQHDSTLVYTFLERGQHRYQERNYKGALEDYEHALKLEPDNAEIFFARGQAKEKLNDLKGAFSDYTRAIDLEEGHAGVWLSRGNVLLKLNRYHDAIEDYNIALIYNTEMASGYFNRALAKLKLNVHPEACADLQQAEKLGMTVDKKLKEKACR